MKNCDEAECGALVRAMAMEPTSFFSPFFASCSIAAVRLLLHAGRHAAALDHEAVDHAVNTVPL